MSSGSSNERLAKNTAILYVRMFLSMAISLYTSRITLQYLGVENYGIYNVIGGVVMFVTTLSAAFTNSAQRFLALAIGKGDENLLRKYFLTIENIHILLSILFLIVAELFSRWLIEEYLSIPSDRINAAYIVFHLSVMTMVFSIVIIPYVSLLMAEERLSIYAFISISEQILRLIGLLILVHVSGDSLIWFSFFAFCLSLYTALFSCFYCLRHYWKIVKYKYEIDRIILKDIWSFVSWAYLGSFSGIAKEHGVNIIIGHYFGVAINAARGVSMQVYSALVAFGNNFISALRPQIVKSYGSGEIVRSINLTSFGVKMTFFLMYIILLPLILECSFILNLWLVEVPNRAVSFTRLVLVLCILRTIQDPINTLYLAIGKIKKSQIISVVYTLLCLALCILAFSIGLEPEFSVWISILLEIVNSITTCYLLSELIKVDWNQFLKGSLLPIARILLLTLPLTILFLSLMNEGLVRFVLVIILSIILNVVSIFFFGLNDKERSMFICFVKSKYGENVFVKNRLFR